MKRFIFIVNKKSGTKKNITKEKILNYIPKHIQPLIFFTNSKQEAEQILEKYNDEEYFVAGGGDGTVNFVVNKLYNTNKKLFIMPLGSGNATARHLDVPMGIKSLKRLKKDLITIKADVVSFQNKKGIAVSGIGLDGKISYLFENLKIRGLKTYIALSLKTFFNFKPFSAEIILNDNSIIKKKNLLLIAIANTNQFGNNAFIAPNASITDNIINICLLEKPPLYKLPIITLYLFTKNINKSKYYSSFTSKKGTIKTNTKQNSHTDGEPISTITSTFKFKINGYINILK